MQYLSPQIEVLSKKKNAKSLVKKEVSCGIFQGYEGMENRAPKNEYPADNIWQ